VSEKFRIFIELQHSALLLLERLLNICKKTAHSLAKNCNAL
jgi:hypothetical protein